MGRTSDANDRLLAAARTLMWERGYGAVSVNELCETAGVKPGSFYYFYSSKSDLTVDALEAAWKNMNESVLQPAAEADAPLDRLTAFFQRLHDLYTDEHEQTGHVLGCPFGNFAGELLALDESIQAKLEEIFDRYRAYFETILRDAADEGLVDPEAVPRKAQALLSFTQGTLLLARIHNDPSLFKTLIPEFRAVAQ